LKLRIPKLLESKTARDAASLNMPQACPKLIPFVMTPNLERLLGPCGLRHIAFADRQDLSPLVTATAAQFLLDRGSDLVSTEYRRV
jgi:hypothetical protein